MRVVWIAVMYLMVNGHRTETVAVDPIATNSEQECIAHAKELAEIPLRTVHTTWDFACFSVIVK